MSAYRSNVNIKEWTEYPVFNALFCSNRILKNEIQMEWLTNIQLGAKPTHLKITPEITKLAIKATEMSNLKVSGRDT